jgi:hypothetical protein
MEKTQCKRCHKFREFLDKEGICIFCVKELKMPDVEGIEVRMSVNENVRGITIKSKDGKWGNLWMGK